MYSPSQSPSSMYSHAPTVIHHAAHRSALARRATRQLANWAESPTSTTAHDEDDYDNAARYHSPSAGMRDGSKTYAYNGNYSTEIGYYSDRPGDHENGDADDTTSPAGQLSSMRAGPTVRKYADLNFDDEDFTDMAGIGQLGYRAEKGEWGTPESTLAGVGRQAARMMRAATTVGKKVSGGSELVPASTKSCHSISPSQSIESRKSGSGSALGSGSAKQRFGDFLGAVSRGGRQSDHQQLQFSQPQHQQLYSSGSKVSIASDRSAKTTSTDSSLGEAVITPNLSSAFTPSPYHDSSTKYTYPYPAHSSSAKDPIPATATIGASGRTYRTAATASSSDPIVRSRIELSSDRSSPLAPSAQIYDPATNCNTLASPSPALFSLSPTPSGFAASDRPLLSSGSPGFGLISLEAAQQREQVRLGGQGLGHGIGADASTADYGSNAEARSTPRMPAVSSQQVPQTVTAKQSQKIKNKKSLISLIRSATSYATGSAPPLPGRSSASKKAHIGEPLPLIRVPPPNNTLATPVPACGKGYDAVDAWIQGYGSMLGDNNGENGQRDSSSAATSRNLVPGPKLELRPVSMMLANGLPEDYLATSSSSSASSGMGDTFPTDGRSGVFTASSSLASAMSGAPSEGAVDAQAESSSSSPEVLALKREIANLKKTHQIQASELSSQLRETRDQLQLTLDEMHTLRAETAKWAPKEDGCAECGCTCGMAVSEMLMGSAPSPSPRPVGRARSGTTATTASTATSRSLRSVKSTRSRHAQEGRAAEMAHIPIPAIPANSDKIGGGGRGVMDRARVKTGGARGVFGTGSLYEWE